MEFWKLEEFPQNPKSSKFLEFPKFQKPKKIHPKVGNFGNSRNLLDFLNFEAPARVSKHPNLGVDFFGFLEFWKLEEFARFLDFEAPARVSKNPNLGVDFFWNFGNSRNLLGFRILRLPLEFPKSGTLGWIFWIFGFLETRGILEWCFPPPPPLPEQTGNIFPGSVEGGGGDHIYI